MRYALNGPLKEYRNKRRKDKMRTKLTETTLITPASILNKTKHNKGVKECIFLLRYCHTLVAGLYQVT